MPIDVLILKRLQENDATLTYLYLGSNNLGTEEVKELAKALKTNTTVTTLDLKRNNLGDEAVNALIEILTTNRTLTTLNLWHNNLSHEGVKALANVLETNGTLTTLNLGHNNLSHEGVKALANVLETNGTLTTLNLGYNNLGPEGIKALVKVLETNTTLISLNLWENNVGDEEVKALAKILETNTTLTHLDLGSNNVGPEGVKALAKILETNRSLTFLELGYNKLGAEGKKYLRDALAINFILLNLNGIYDSEITQYLKRNGIMAQLIRSLQESLGNNVGSFIDGTMITTYLVQLNELEINFETLDEKQRPNEFFRLLTGLGYIANYHAANELSSLFDAFQSFTPAFTNTSFQALADEALYSSIHILYNNSAGQRNLNTKHALLETLLYGLRHQLNNQDFQLIAYDAFAQLEKNAGRDAPQEVSLQEIRLLQGKLVLLSYEEALTITEGALNLCRTSEEQNIHELNLLTELLCQKEYKPLVIHYLFKSPTFVAMLQALHTQEEFLFIEDYIFSEEKKRICLEEQPEGITQDLLDIFREQIRHSTASSPLEAFKQKINTATLYNDSKHQNLKN